MQHSVHKRHDRWQVFKSYYQDPEGGDLLTDTLPILYATEQEAGAMMTQLEAGCDPSFFDANGNDSAGYDAVLYVDRVWL
jgi:hypothetical protein